MNPIQNVTVEQSTNKENQENNSTIKDLVISNYITRGTLKKIPLRVRLRYEEDVAEAYRSWYKDQIVHDRRNEVGRFLFTVSFATIGLIVSVFKFSAPINGFSADVFWYMGCSVGVLLLSSSSGLYLAVTKNFLIDPNEVELVKLHYKRSKELKFLTIAWGCLWAIGLIVGIVGIVL